MLVTVILVVLIVCFMVVTIFSLTALFVLRRREQQYEGAQKVERAVEELDAALNIALEEVNKIGALVQGDIDEKYKAMLFLYSLVEEKQKEIAETADGEVISEMMEKYLETHEDKLRLLAGEVREAQDKSEESDKGEKPKKIVEPKKPPKFTNPKHKQIWEMREGGQAVSDIAKERGMGQGEVKLILDLIDRG